VLYDNGYRDRYRGGVDRVVRIAEYLPFLATFRSRAFSACVHKGRFSHNGVLDPLFTRIRVFTS